MKSQRLLGMEEERAMEIEVCRYEERFGTGAIAEMVRLGERIISFKVRDINGKVIDKFKIDRKTMKVI